jgi:dTDP-4-amino-4,6-dideoxygalactose transaminase
MHLQPFYKDSDYITTENGISICDDIFSTGVCLPSDSKMTDDDLERVVGVVKDEMGASR